MNSRFPIQAQTDTPQQCRALPKPANDGETGFTLLGS